MLPLLRKTLSLKIIRYLNTNLCDDPEHPSDNIPPVYNVLGDLIIESRKPQSPLNTYFHGLQTEALKPENDRVSRAINMAIKMLHNDFSDVTAD